MALQKHSTSTGGEIACMKVTSNRSEGKKMVILHTHVNAADLGIVAYNLCILHRNVKLDIYTFDYCGYGSTPGKPSEGES